jgi:hypothetical protein
MASGKSTSMANAVLDFMLGSGSPATLYFAAYTTTPSAAGGGTEVTGGSYARVAKTNNATNFPAASGAQKSNGTTITFPQATADWGLIKGIAILDAASGGNLRAFADLVTNRQVYSGDQPSFAAGALVFTEV